MKKSLELVTRVLGGYFWPLDWTAVGCPLLTKHGFVLNPFQSLPMLKFVDAVPSLAASPTTLSLCLTSWCPITV